ncbi:P-loop containing nucleoside triphosphate hydrolase protein [Polychaeton citri CBS 116435]|uniref:P-loop containing nucleoside triphosphate hydrolase protein n=1 Tax=Polychaeton citri CBS 116435 TaxID=1314669 RepID=A0A9P4UMR8_9PEZI|nr:P-loop containing nucleoside triphosphate hydrolase protein [Polychaeton citri CBS 116435]
MKRLLTTTRPSRLLQHQLRYNHDTAKPAIAIKEATFYRQYPQENEQQINNPALFPDLTFELRDFSSQTPSNGNSQYWAVISPSSIARTTFLQILAGQHVCIPPTARSYPLLSALGIPPHHGIKYVGFDADRGNKVGGTGVRGAYLSARYEARREESDFSVLDYLTGNTELNPLETENTVKHSVLEQITAQLNLRKLLDMPVANLSNGQTRRARIAKALMVEPEILLLDGPFMGLDPNTLASMSNVLRRLAKKNKPRLIMSLRPEDGVPDWVTRLCVIDSEFRVLAQGGRDELFRGIAHSTEPSASRILQHARTGHNASTVTQLSKDGFGRDSVPPSSGEALVEMQGVQVSYGDKTVLGAWQQPSAPSPGLYWSLHRGQRAGVFGANGSGKTTLLSLITSDHPQTYSLPIKLFGRSRLPDLETGLPGIGIFDLQKRMGHSSPEIHAFFPRSLSVRRSLESAWADTPAVRPKLTEHAKLRVDGCLRWFARELNPRLHNSTTIEKLENAHDLTEAKKMYDLETEDDIDIKWAQDMLFGELSFSSQRLILLLRALVGSPDLVILDEALSGIDEAIRDKALLFLSHGEKVSRIENDTVIESTTEEIGKVVLTGLQPQQALLVISHAREDVPGCVREWICLPEPGEGRLPRTGSLKDPLELRPEGWNEIWGKS